MSIEEVAIGFVKVANEAMCRPIRALTQAKGNKSVIVSKNTSHSSFLLRL